MSNEWSEEFPTEAGAYWLYGLSSVGSMGMHYREDFDVTKQPMEFYYVKVQKLGDDKLTGVTEGYFISKHKFDKNKRIEGYCGKFKPVQFPEPPELSLK